MKKTGLIAEPEDSRGNVEWGGELMVSSPSGTQKIVVQSSRTKVPEEFKGEGILSSPTIESRNLVNGSDLKQMKKKGGKVY